VGEAPKIKRSLEGQSFYVSVEPLEFHTPVGAINQNKRSLDDQSFSVSVERLERSTTDLKGQ
jgi:hypothetical protein